MRNVAVAILGASFALAGAGYFAQARQARTTNYTVKITVHPAKAGTVHITAKPPKPDARSQ
jgi:hypothetical protein